MHFIIKNQDAIIALKEIPNETVDCIITDPPYPTISGGHGGAAVTKIGAGENGSGRDC